MAKREITAPPGVNLGSWCRQQGLINPARAARILHTTPEAIPGLIEHGLLTDVTVHRDGHRNRRILVAEVNALAADDVCVGCGVSARRRNVCPNCWRALTVRSKWLMMSTPAGSDDRNRLVGELRLFFAKRSTRKITHRPSAAEVMADVALELRAATEPVYNTRELWYLGHPPDEVDTALATLARDKILRWESVGRVRLLDPDSLGRLLERLEPELPDGD